MRRFFPAASVCILALFVLFSAAPSAAFEASYVSSQQLNLAKLLAPPPAPESNMQKADLSAVLFAQEARTEQQADRAVRTITRRFSGSQMVCLAINSPQKSCRS